MVILDLKADNFYAFKNFHVNFTYPKKIVGSYIEEEHLVGFPNFRYKKVNIIMGANASGKTTLGYMLKNIFNFIAKKNAVFLIDHISDISKKASFCLEMVCSGKQLYRVRCNILPFIAGDDAKGHKINLHVTSLEIGKRDSYESCVKKLDKIENLKEKTYYMEELDKIERIAWLFEHPDDVDRALSLPDDDKLFPVILKKVLKALDPSISNVEKLDNVRNSYVIRLAKEDIILQDGERFGTKVLSSGTKAGVEVAAVLSSLIQGRNSFYYCDEKFSYIHTDIEKAILSVMIESIKPNEQLFFTTHNTEILDLDLPKHSYCFMKKEVDDKNEPIKCLSASDFLKRNTDSLKKAVENDLFSIAPSTDIIYDILDLNKRN